MTSEWVIKPPRLSSFRPSAFVLSRSTERSLRGTAPHRTSHPFVVDLGTGSPGRVLVAYSANFPHRS